MQASLHLWVVPLLCLAGFVLNLLFGRLWSRTLAGTLGVLFPAGAFAYAVWAALQWRQLGQTIVESHAAWISAGTLSIPYAFQLDQLSAIMMLIVTGVGLLIHIYSLAYMWEEGGYYRFFAYLNMFMFFMLMLVLSSSYLLMFVGWEGVGFASYVLIGFFFRKKSAAAAGMKAFVVNRIGDFAFLVALYEIFHLFGSFDFAVVFPAVQKLAVSWSWTSPLTLIALCLFAGATGKSAQIPLYVWLPDAMEGPTPVSALIHAATMVTAGVYMVARSASIYDRAPHAQSVVLAIGALTALLAATIGLLQRDIKRILAYSTVSQLGYMFMACGVASYGAGIFHLMTHAFFKGLLFLGAGSVIHAMHGEQDIWAIRAHAPGGLRKYAPITFITFLVATCAISGIPFFSGFYSKDRILYDVATAGGGHLIWWGIGTLAALMTSFYMFRALFVTFFSGAQTQAASGKPAHAPHESPFFMTAPLVILAILALTGGYVGIHNRFENFLAPVFQTGVAARPVAEIQGGEMTVTAISVGVALLGLLLAWLFYIARPRLAESLARSLAGLHKLVFNKFYVDEIYGALITRPLAAFSAVVLGRGIDRGLIAGIIDGAAATADAVGGVFAGQASGYLRSYSGWLVAAAALVLFFALYLGVR